MPSAFANTTQIGSRVLRTMPGMYTQQWREYRRWHRAAVLGFVLGMPGAVLLAIGIRKLTGQETSIVAVATLIPWLVIWAWLAFRLVRFPCPRCGVPFLANQEPEIKTSRVCSKCGLKLYEEL